MVRLLGLVLCAVVLLVARSWASGGTSIIALAKTDSVTVKIVDPGAYRAGSGLSYKISHWPEGQVLSQGQVASKNVTADEIGLPTFKLTGLRPRLWSPQDPQLYEIEVRGSAGALLGRARFGFRTFEARSGSFYLNGRPIFLRGFPINPPRILPSIRPGFQEILISQYKREGLLFSRLVTGARTRLLLWPPQTMLIWLTERRRSA